jgi:hypothetical protein
LIKPLIRQRLYQMKGIKVIGLLKEYLLEGQTMVFLVNG